MILARNMSAAEIVAVIHSVYTYLRTTYKNLKQNEDDVRNLLEEVFLYENMINVYEAKIKVEKNSSIYFPPIKMFYEGISGMKELFVNYSTKQSNFKRAWVFCKAWCCTAKNAAKIKSYTEKLSKSIRDLGFAAEILITQKIDQVMVGQTDMSKQFCEILPNLKPVTVRSSSIICLSN